MKIRVRLGCDQAAVVALATTDARLLHADDVGVIAFECLLNRLAAEQQFRQADSEPLFPDTVRTVE